MRKLDACVWARPSRINPTTNDGKALAWTRGSDANAASLVNGDTPSLQGIRGCRDRLKRLKGNVGARPGWGADLDHQPAGVAVECVDPEVELHGEQAIGDSQVGDRLRRADLIRARRGTSASVGVPQAELEVGGFVERLTELVDLTLVGEGRGKRVSRRGRN